MTTTSTTSTTARTTLPLFVAAETLSLFGNSAISIVQPGGLATVWSSPALPSPVCGLGRDPDRALADGPAPD